MMYLCVVQVIYQKSGTFFCVGCLHSCYLRNDFAVYSICLVYCVHHYEKKIVNPRSILDFWGILTARFIILYL